MKENKHMKTITNILHSAIGVLALACFALSPTGRAQDAGETDTNGNSAMEGSDALSSLTTGINNTALGLNALYSNTSGSENTANGAGALYSNTTGNFNTAIGETALAINTIGHENTANGVGALYSNTTGYDNTANGMNALYSNTTASYNTATGHNSLIANQTGHNNTADGQNALKNNTTGSNNIALGSNAGTNLTTGNNNIDIGNAGMASESDTIRIGTQATHTKTFIAGISGAAIGGMEVRVNQNGRLGIEPSSKRFKDEIKPMDRASEAILALKPVTFRYKKEIDADRTPQFGLVAEDVEKVHPDLVVRDAEGKVYTVRYDAVNAMLHNEFLKEHRKNEEQEATIAQLKKELQTNAAHHQKQIDALSAALQKVSAQLELSKAAPQTVLNNQ